MGKIYLIRCSEENDILYKIGFSINPHKRRKTLETGNPNDLEVIDEFFTNYDRKLETAIHNRFRSKKIRREWFKLDDNDIRNFKDSCQKMEDNFKLLEKENYYFKKLLVKKTINK